MPELEDVEPHEEHGEMAPKRRPPSWLIALTAVVALLAAGTVGHALGSVRSTPDSASADAGFARDMRDHHLQAVLMSDIIRDRTTDPDLRYLAYDIASGQRAQAGMMSGWLQQWGLNETDGDRSQMAWMAGVGGEHGSGHGSGDGGQNKHLLADGRMPGMATTQDISRLRTLSGREVEVLWLQLMVEHHRGGVLMAQAAAELVEAPYERHLATSIVESQTAEIRYLTELLGARGATAP